MLTPRNILRPWSLRLLLPFLETCATHKYVDYRYVDNRYVDNRYVDYRYVDYPATILQELPCSCERSLSWPPLLVRTVAVLASLARANSRCPGLVCVVLQLWTAQPPLAEWIRRGQPAHTPPQRPPGAERKGRHKGRKHFSKPDCTGEGRRKRTHA
eukprot:362916-Chlamydomonas_euryale.AAC.1